jgi:hypothetical protein
VAFFFVASFAPFKLLAIQIHVKAKPRRIRPLDKLKAKKKPARFLWRALSSNA